MNFQFSNLHLVKEFSLILFKFQNFWFLCEMNWKHSNNNQNSGIISNKSIKIEINFKFETVMISMTSCDLEFFILMNSK